MRETRRVIVPLCNDVHRFGVERRIKRVMAIPVTIQSEVQGIPQDVHEALGIVQCPIVVDVVDLLRFLPRRVHLVVGDVGMIDRYTFSIAADSGKIGVEFAVILVDHDIPLTRLSTSRTSVFSSSRLLDRLSILASMPDTHRAVS